MNTQETKELIKQFNSSSDYDILNYLVGNSLSLEEKEYLIIHCQDRINLMDIDVFLQLIRQISQELCERCSEYISSKIKLLTIPQIENLLYINKYEHNVSPIADFLLKSDWFQAEKEKYKSFIIAYNLEKLLDNESIDKKELVSMGIDIINQLTSIDCEPMLFDMVMKNYLCLLKKFHSEYFETFKRKGYEVINKQIDNELEITINMIIFDCGITKFEFSSDIVDYCEFYNDEKVKEFAYAHAGKIRINVSAIKHIYEKYESKKIGTQFLFYVLGHEIDHVFCQRYEIIQKNTEENLMTELKVFNSRMSSAFQQIVNKKYYLAYHNCFSHEYAADINGIKTLYDKQKYLPSIDLESKEIINRYLAQILLSSYCRINDGSISGYVGPVEFTREGFNNFKDDLPGYVYHCLLYNQTDLPKKLEIVEGNISEEEKFLLGYYNKYIGILELIVNGDIKSTNLFNDINNLYNEYKDLVIGKYPQYLADDNIIKK